VVCIDGIMSEDIHSHYTNNNRYKEQEEREKFGAASKGNDRGLEVDK
jgi:hypothetical protein